MWRESSEPVAQDFCCDRAGSYWVALGVPDPPEGFTRVPALAQINPYLLRTSQSRRRDLTGRGDTGTGPVISVCSVERASKAVTKDQLEWIQKEELSTWIGEKRHPGKQTQHVQRP